MSTLETIFIGALSSIVASLIWFSLTILFHFYGRRNIDYLLDLALDSTRQFQNALQYDEYYFALTQCDQMIQFIKEAHQNIKILTYFPQKKKLIVTLLNNVWYFCSIAKNITMGYEGNRELRARTETLKSEHLFIIDSLEKKNETYLTCSLKLAQELNRSFSVSKVLKEFSVFCNEQNQGQLFKDILVKHTTISNHGWKHDGKKGGFGYDEYMEYIDEKLSGIRR